MSIQHTLSFPIQQFETATSYVSRLALWCGLGSPSDLCLDWGFRWQDFVRGDDALFGKVGELGGARAADLKRWAVRSKGPNRFEVSGQQGTRNSLIRSRLRVCPQCLVKDYQQGGRCGRYRRYFWQFASVRTCAVHNMPLLSIPPEKYTILNYDFAGQISQHWNVVNRAADAGEERSFTPFESYILQRLEGKLAVPFLDDMPMHLATRLCEVLGFVLLAGPGRKLSSGTEDEMLRAGQLGFEALEDGKSGLFAALDQLVTPMAVRTVRHQTDFGALFEWLRSSALGDEFEILKDEVRDYIFRTYPLRVGDMVLGKPCEKETTFTIHRAWQSLGIQRKRMNRVLIAEGLAAKRNDDNAVWLNEGLKSADLDRFSERLASRLTANDAANFLNISGETLQGLRDAGVLTPISDALDVIPKYRQRDLDCFMMKVSKGAVHKAQTGEARASIIDASRRVRCPSADIVHLILEGRLAKISRDENTRGLAGLTICLQELRQVLPPLEMAAIPKGEASRLLRVTYPTINYLIDEGHLTSQRVRNPKSRQFIDAVCQDSIADFSKTYETLGELAHRYKRASGPLGCHLEAKGICPIETPPKISWYYERKGLDRRIQKAGVSLAVDTERERRQHA